MAEIKIYCDQYDFSALAEAIGGGLSADCPLALEIVFVEEPEIRRLNREFRSNDKVTDVLSFPTLDDICGKELKGEDFPYDTDEDGTLFLGSVAICTKVAKEQAEEYGHPYERELNYLAVHGACHLLGYDHMTDGEKAAMREKEESVLGKMNLARE